jgi:hypothetical protein
MAEDILLLARRQTNNAVLEINDHIINLALIQLEDKVIQMTGFKLSHFQLQSPHRSVTTQTSHDIIRETSYDIDELRQYVADNEPRLDNVPQQKAIYARLLHQIHDNAGGIFFLDAPGGTGKTFLINLVLAKVRSEGYKALATASSGIAATLMHGGRTVHSTFKLPFNLTRDESPVCRLSADSSMAEVLRQCKCIVWDECTMAHKRRFKTVGRTIAQWGVFFFYWLVTSGRHCL